MAITATIVKSTEILLIGDEVMHDDQQWTVETITTLEQAPNALYDLKLHRVPGRQDDALSEDWQDVTASDDEQWDVILDGPRPEGTLALALLFANKDPNTGIYGDIYSQPADVLRDHSRDQMLTGYGVLDLNTGLLTAASADFYKTATEAQDAMEQERQA